MINISIIENGYEMILEDIDKMITGKKYKEALKSLDSIKEDKLSLTERAYFIFLEGRALFKTDSSEAEKFLKNALKMYCIFVQMGIAESTIIFLYARCALCLGNLYYKYGAFKIAKELYAAISGNIIRYDNDFMSKDRLIARHIQVKALEAKVKLLDKTKQFRESVPAQKKAVNIRRSIDVKGYDESKLDKYLFMRDLFEHNLKSGSFEEAYHEIQELVEYGREFLTENFELYCEEVGKADILISKLFLKCTDVHSAKSYAKNAVKKLESICREPYNHTYVEPVLSRAYAGLAETYMTGESSEDNYLKAEMYLIKGYRIAKRLFEENSLLYMELFAKINSLMGEFYYLSRPKEKPAKKGVPYCLKSASLYRFLYTERSKSAYWESYSCSLLLLSSIFKDIKKLTSDKAAALARKLMDKHIFINAVKIEENDPSGDID